MAFNKGDKKPENSGRAKGVQNKTTAALKEMILGALDSKGGQVWLESQMDENPVAFMTLLGKVLPTQVNADVKGSMSVTFAIPAPKKEA